MTQQATPSAAPRALTARARVVTHAQPLHLRSLSHPLSQREAMDLFARHELAETFAAKCA